MRYQEDAAANWMAICLGVALALVVGGIVLKLGWFLVAFGWNLL